MAVTIREVARAAGVSVATVSRVLNDSGPVHEETRRRVREAVAHLRYAPHAAARSLITSRTNTVGVILPDLHGEFFSEVIRGLDAAARRGGFHLLVSGAHADPAELAALLRAVRGRVDGLVVMSPDLDAAAALAHLPDGVPVVLLNGPPVAGAAAALAVDNHGGATSVMRHLLALGHRRIAHLGGGERNHDARERRRGYRDALRDAGLPWDGALELTGDFSERGGHAAAARLLALDPRPRAIFCANDAMAIGLVSALREAGLRVPADVAVAGFDDVPLARYLDPPLTSVHVDLAGLGARAMDRLVQAIQDGVQATGPPPCERFAATLVVRASCGAASPASPRPVGHARARPAPPSSVETCP